MAKNKKFIKEPENALTKALAGQGTTPIPSFAGGIPSPDLPSPDISGAFPTTGGNVLVDRLAKANVPPYQPGMSQDVSDALLKAYGLKVKEKIPELQAQREQQLTNLRAEALANITAQTGMPASAQQALTLMANPSQTFGASALGAAPDILSQGLLGGGIAAAGGIAAGAAALPLIPLIAGGFILNSGRAALTELKQEEQQGAAVQYTEFKNAKDDLNKIINEVNAGGDPIQSQTLFNFAIAKIDRTESNLKMLEKRDWLTKAKKQLIAVQSFNDLERESYIRRFNEALIRPDKTKIIPMAETKTEETEI